MEKNKLIFDYVQVQMSLLFTYTSVRTWYAVINFAFDLFFWRQDFQWIWSDQ